MSHTSEKELKQRLSGLTIDSLPPLDCIKQSDLFMLSRQNVDISESRSCLYSTLSSQMSSYFSTMLSVGTMAFESKRKYARADHIHFGEYSSISVLSCLEPGENREKIMSISLSGENGEKTYDIYAPIIHVLARKPEVGTLKFVYSRNKLRTVTQQDLLADEWDGWAYPDGSEFEVDPEVFAEALEAYGVEGTTNRIRLPILDKFFETVAGPVSDFGTQLPQEVSAGAHIHDVSSIAFSGKIKLNDNQTLPTYCGDCGNKNGNIHYGKNEYTGIGSSNFTMDLSQIKFEKLSCGDCIGCQAEGEFRPRNMLIPVMIYIGGVV